MRLRMYQQEQIKAAPDGRYRQYPQPFEPFDAVAKVRTNRGGMMTPVARLGPEARRPHLYYRHRSITTLRCQIWLGHKDGGERIGF